MNNNTSKINSNMGKLGEKIEKLVHFVSARSNIHKEIGSMSREIQALFMHVSSELRGSTNIHLEKPRDNKETQTVSSELRGSTNIRMENPMDNKETQTEARPKLVPVRAPAQKRSSTNQSPNGSNAKKKKKTSTKEVVKNGPENNPPVVSEIGEMPKTRVESNWQTVRSKTRMRKAPTRHDALVIKTCGDTSYADILRQVKSDPTLNALGENVKSIRKTEKGELLLQLNKPAHQNTSEFKKSVEDALGSTAEVRALSQEVLLEIKDIDEVTTKEDVYEAIRRESEIFKIVQQSAVRTLRRAYGGTQTATIGLSATLANKLLEIGKIRIGWVFCRVREKIAPRRCYKCLNFGHTAGRCKGQNDYSGRCLRCGEDGHKIKTCSKSPKCLLCKDTESISNHVTGSVICPQYKRALHKLTRPW